MTNVLLVNYTGSKGGGALYALEMTREFLRQNISCVAVIASHNENLSEWEKLSLEKLVIIDTYESNASLIKKSFFWKNTKNDIKEQLRTFQIGTIFTPMITFWTKKINHLFPKATDIHCLHDPTPHTGDFFQIILNLFGQQSVISNASYVVVFSPNFIEFVEKKYNKTGKVIYLPMGNYDFYENLQETKAPVSYNPDFINFVFFGRISKYKGLGELGTAYEQVSQITDKVSLTIAGSGDFSDYKKIYEPLPNVTIVNRWIDNDEVEGFFKGENLIAVLPYRDATQSGVIQICKIFGIPVIATRTGGLVAQLEDFKDASILVNPADPVDLAKKMSQVILDDELRENLYLHAKKYEPNDEWFQSVTILKELIK